jgi:hypothetical protein
MFRLLVVLNSRSYCFIPHMNPCRAPRDPCRRQECTTIIFKLLSKVAILVVLSVMSVFALLADSDMSDILATQKDNFLLLTYKVIVKLTFAVTAHSATRPA